MATKQEIAVHLIKINLRYLTPNQLRGIIDECLSLFVEHVVNSKKMKL